MSLGRLCVAHTDSAYSSLQLPPSIDEGVPRALCIPLTSPLYSLASRERAPLSRGSSSCENSPLRRFLYFTLCTTLLLCHIHIIVSILVYAVHSRATVCNRRNNFSRALYAEFIALSSTSDAKRKGEPGVVYIYLIFSQFHRLSSPVHLSLYTGKRSKATNFNKIEVIHTKKERKKERKNKSAKVKPSWRGVYICIKS